MSFNNYTSDALPPRDIRRYPSELDRVPSRSAARSPEAERKPTFSEVAAEVAGARSANVANATPTGAPAGKNGAPFSLWEKEGFDFGDFIDIINPLHHIPIVATIYRNLSGDQIGAAPRVIGGALWGRIGGFVAGAVNAVVEWWTGKDIGDHIYAAVFGDPKKVDGGTSVATRKAAPSQSAESASAAAVESPPAAAPENDAVGPAALLSEPSPILAPPARAALTSYEKNRDRGEPDESLGICLPA
ncbi:MAG TPA: hypothetical protein VGB27_13000 [Candidatus Binatia bacterium]